MSNENKISEMTLLLFTKVDPWQFFDMGFIHLYYVKISKMWPYMAENEVIYQYSGNHRRFLTYLAQDSTLVKMRSEMDTSLNPI